MQVALPTGHRRAVGSGSMADDSSRLFEQATGGDQQALDQLLVRYLPQLHAYVHVRLGPALRRRESSLDVVQSVCRELLSAERPAWNGEDRFRAWLFTSALNKLRERHRRAYSGKRDLSREEPDGALESFAALAHLVTPSQEAIGREVGAAVHAALTELSEEHREVITLARLVGLPHGVIAEVMGRSEAATRQLLARGMVQLVNALRRRGVGIDGGRP